jgi:hypothetical protein
MSPDKKLLGKTSVEFHSLDESPKPGFWGKRHIKNEIVDGLSVLIAEHLRPEEQCRIFPEKVVVQTSTTHPRKYFAHVTCKSETSMAVNLTQNFTVGQECPGAKLLVLRKPAYRRDTPHVSYTLERSKQGVVTWCVTVFAEVEGEQKEALRLRSRSDGEIIPSWVGQFTDANFRRSHPVKLDINRQRSASGDPLYMKELADDLRMHVFTGKVQGCLLRRGEM